MRVRCMIPYCSGNHQFDIKKHGPVHTFYLPTDPVRRQLWLDHIPYKSIHLYEKRNAVCERHFDPKFISLKRTMRGKKGITFTKVLSKPVLSKDAYPSIFPKPTEAATTTTTTTNSLNNTSHTSTSPIDDDIFIENDSLSLQDNITSEEITSTNSPHIESHEVAFIISVPSSSPSETSSTSAPNQVQAISNNHSPTELQGNGYMREQETLRKKFRCLNDIKSAKSMITKFTEYKLRQWLYFEERRKVYFIKIKESNCPRVVASLVINEDLSCDLFRSSVPVVGDEKRKLLGVNLKCRSWAHLKKILNFLIKVESESV